jgi:hypothetical protein
MELYSGVSQAALQEAAQQHLMTSAEKKRKTGEAERESGIPFPALQQDEAEVKDAERFAQVSQERLEKAQSALSHIPPARQQKLETVNRRIKEGFYDQKLVVECIAEKLLTMFRGGGHAG